MCGLVREWTERDPHCGRPSQARSREQCLPVLRELCQPRVSAQLDSPLAAEDKPGTRAISRDIHTPDRGKLMGVCSLEVGQVHEATTRHDGWLGLGSSWGRTGEAGHLMVGGGQGQGPQDRKVRKRWKQTSISPSENRTVWPCRDKSAWS